MESNFDILGIPEGSTAREVREAFRRLALLHHSDRGGEDEKFKRIKQAYEDLKEGKKYPGTGDPRRGGRRARQSESEEDIRRRNALLAAELARDMARAEEWVAGLARAGAAGTRLFGSKTLGEVEFERKASGAVSIRGNYMAGRFSHDGPVLMQGNVTSPSWSPRHSTAIRLRRGDFKMVDAVDNKYRIENGARITADAGDIVVGNVFGRKDRVQDPDGRVGLYRVREHRTELSAPRGRVVLQNAADTVSISGDTVVALNLEDDVRLRGREILIYGGKITYDVVISLARGGTIRFFEGFSVQGLSDDCTVELEGGGSVRLHDAKTKRVRDLPGGLAPDPGTFGRDDTMVGGGFTITYDMLDYLGGGRGASGGAGAGARRRRGWASRLGLGGG